MDGSSARRAPATCSTRSRRSASARWCPGRGSSHSFATPSRARTRTTSTRSRWAASRSPSRTRWRPRPARTRGEVERLVADPRAFSRAWWDHTYAARGLYAEQLERWLAVFPSEQLLVVRTEDLGERPAETYAAILAFLGAEAHELEEYPRIFGREYAEMRPETRAALTGAFAEPNRRLEVLLGRELGW